MCAELEPYENLPIALTNKYETNSVSKSFKAQYYEQQNSPTRLATML